MRAGRSYANPTFVGRAPRTGSGTITLGFAVETDTAFALGISAAGFEKTPSAILHNTLAISRAKRLLGKPNDVFIMSPGANLGGAYVNFGTETDTGLAMVPASKIITLGLATETDTGIGMSVAPAEQTVTLGLAEEIDTGLPLVGTTGNVLLFATETDTGLPLSPIKTVTLGLAVETDTALGLARNEIQLGLAIETDTAFALGVRFPQHFFTPPAVSIVPPVLPVGDPAQTVTGYRLFRHFRSRPEGRNVYLLSNGVVTEDDPDGTRVVWAPDDRTSENLNAPYVLRAFYGGHDDYELTQEQAETLVSEGYTVVTVV